MTTIAAGASALVAIARGSTLKTTGSGTAVFGPGRKANMQVGLSGSNSFGPYASDETLCICATSQVIYATATDNHGLPLARLSTDSSGAATGIIGTDGNAISLGSGAAPRAAYLGQVATACAVSNYQTGATASAMSRKGHFATETITSLKLGIPTGYVLKASTKAETNAGGTTDITAAIEYPAGVFTQVKFGGAAQATAIAAGLTLLSDDTAVSIPVGAQFWTRIWRKGTTNITLCEDMLPSAGDFVDIGANVSDRTMGGTITQTAGVNYTYAPLLILGTTTRETVLIMGDSINWGQGDFADNTLNLGQIARSLGTKYGYSNVAQQGEQAVQFNASNAKRLALKQYFTKVVNNFGINDFGVGAITSAALVTAQQATAALFSDKDYYLCTLHPITSDATNGWVGTSTQTGRTYETERMIYNARILGGAVQTRGIIDIQKITESGNFSSLWGSYGAGTALTGATQAWTVDGVHPNSSGHRRIQSSGIVPTVMGL